MPQVNEFSWVFSSIKLLLLIVMTMLLFNYKKNNMSMIFQEKNILMNYLITLN